MTMTVFTKGEKVHPYHKTVMVIVNGHSQKVPSQKKLQFNFEQLRNNHQL